MILKPPTNESAASKTVLENLKEMGCHYEGAHPGFYAIDVPPEVDLMKVREYLISTGQEWEHGDPTHDDLFPGE